MARTSGQNDFGFPNLIEEFSQALVPRRVGIIEFAEAEEFCNKPLYPRQRVLLKTVFLEELDGYEEDVLTEWIKSSQQGGEVTICPMIRERREALIERGYKHFRTNVLVGGRRCSKSHLVGIALAKKVYDLVQLEDPAEHYQIDRDKNLAIPCFAGKEKQAKETQFADVRNAIEGCKALERFISKSREEGISIYTPADLRKLAEMKRKRMDISRDISRIRVFPSASAAGTIRGYASFAAGFDEMAHMMAGESRLADGEVYGALRPSLLQFKEDMMLWASSSPWTKVGKFFELYQQSMKLSDEFPEFLDYFMIQMPSWELYKDWERDFRWSKAILTYDDVRDEEKADPDKFKVEYRGQFAETLDAFLRPEFVDRMFEGEFQGRTLMTQQAGVGAFRYKAHGDPSSTGANFGIAIGHVEIVTNEETGISEPHVVFDLIDAFYPTDFENGVIDWVEVVLPEITRLIQNFRPFEWTFDQFDSEAPIQMLRKELANRRIEGTRVWKKTATAAVNKRRWDNFKAALYLNRVHAPNPEGALNERSLALASSELKFLQLKNGKVEKQDEGPVTTKDIADCIAEVVDALIGDALLAHRKQLGESRVEAGAEGGYKIGFEGGYRGARGFEAFYREKRSGRGNYQSRVRGNRAR